MGSRSRHGESWGARHVLLWRLPLLATTLAIVAWNAHAWSWAFALALPLAAGMLAVQFFAPAPLERWLSSGYLVLADAVLVSLAILGLGTVPAAFLAGFFAVVFISTLVNDRLRSVAATAALVCLLFALVPGAALPGFGLRAGSAVLVVLFYLSAALAFGATAERMHHRSGERRKDAGELWTLLEIADTIGKSLDFGEVMRSVVQRVGELVRSESCSILLTDEHERNCFVVASKGHPDVDMLELELADYPEIRRAIETREPVLIEDVSANPLVEAVRETLIEKGYRSLLVVPLLFGQEVLGTLFLRARREEPFTPDELKFCKVAAGVSANALKNAMLYREVKREAESHRATGEKMRRIVDGTPDMIVATDVNGAVTEFNAGAEAVTGRTARTVLGRPVAEIFGAAAASTMLDDDTGELRDVSLRRPDDRKMEISLASARLSGPDGESAGRVWIGRDVTKLRRVERSLIQAERLSSLGEVVAGVAHELNNPLSGVVGYAELLRVHAKDPSQIRDLDRIVESSMRCQKIVFKLLSFARKQPSEKKNQSLNECVRKVLDLKSYHLQSSRIETSLELDPQLPETFFDFHHLEQVVLNLLNNAEQAISSIKVPGKIVLRTGVRDGQVFCEVQDNGPGVPSSVRERVFDPFFTTKELGQGTGLGLSVSYGIVRDHGGRIELGPASAEGGAVFTLYLPIVRGVEPRRDASLITEEPSGGSLAGRSILVAEDEPMVLELFSRLLGEAGAQVTQARDGQEAWERLEQADFDLIVTDLRMPNLSGRELYEKVAEERPQMLRRFVFATGDLVREETLSFLEGLPNRIVHKPLEVETVRRVLSQALAATS